MSETWTSLLAGVVGAIVGGAASLAGTVLVNKMQMATNARMRLYDELLPKLEQATDHVYQGRTALPFEDEQWSDAVLAMRRAAAIAGRHERKAVHELAPFFEGSPWRYHDDDAKARSETIRTEIRALSDYLGAKLG